MAHLTTNDPKGLNPDSTFLASEFIPDALFLRVGTNAGLIEGDAPVVRVPYIKEDSTVGFVAEGAEIPGGTEAFDEITVSTRKLAIVSTMSREAFQGQASLGNGGALLSTSMKRSVISAADKAFLDNAADPVGLMNTAGMYDAGEIGANLDGISDAITEIEANGGQATDIIVNPRVWGYLSKLKTTDTSAQLLLGAPGEAVGRKLFGLDVHTSAQMPATGGLILDKSNVLTVAGPLMLAKTDLALFTSDSIVFRAMLRLGWGVIRPNRMAKFSIPAAAPEEPAA